MVLRPEYAEAITVGDLLVRAADRYGDTEALVFPDARFSFTALRQAAERVAAGLYAMGVRPGDRVGILMPNTPDFVHCFYGTAMLGAVAVPINARYKRRELSFVIANAGLKVLLTSDVIEEHADYVALLNDCFPGLADLTDAHDLALPDVPELRSIVLFGRSRPAGIVGEEEFWDLADRTPWEPVTHLRQQVRLRDTAMMMYTSGTTADPKGCPVTHEALVREWLVFGRLIDVGEGDRYWVPCPMFHVSGVGPLLFVLDAGATYLTMTHFDPESSLRQIYGEHPTHLWPLFPFVLMVLLKHSDYDPAKLSGLRVVGHNAPAATLQVAQELLPDGVIQPGFYGLTECAGGVASTGLDFSYDERMSGVVKPLPGIEVRIADLDTGAEVPVGASGEILIRGYCVFEGYWNEPDLTAAALDADGWIHTGDLGLRAEGGFVFTSRIKDMLKVGGENVAAAEIEAVLSTHPDVQVAQVVGRDDEKYIEVPIAFVQLRPGARPVAEQELIGHCARELARWKIPREVRFVEEWPMSATKIQKNKLREMAGAQPLAGSVTSA